MEVGEKYAEQLPKQLEQVGRQILVAARNELYLQMRFLDVALSALPFVMDEAIGTTGTDGLCLYYHPIYLGGAYREDRIFVNRAYLHSVMHCIFKHMLLRSGREAALYHLACDIAVESMVDSMQHRITLKSRSFLRRETYRKLSEKLKVLTAQKVYAQLKKWNLTESQLLQLELEFKVDNHQYWPQDEDRKKQQEIENKWQDMSEQLETDMDTFSSEASAQSGHLLDQIRVENKERYDYRRFLRRFSVLKEELSVDEDTFDYVFYSYGLSLYGNMPLIEPQEWKEVQKIEEFVIVIDTSMSCSGELVKKFLEETYSVLSENNSFFRKVNIHIIQCDNKVQADKKVGDMEELKEYMDNLELYGEGGTDFRPAFAHVDALAEQGEFKALRGLIYFTDGKGTYPSKMPFYDTVFVFMEAQDDESSVPPWAMKLLLDEEELVGENKSK